MSNECIYLLVGDLISSRSTEIAVYTRRAYDTAKDVLQMVGIDPYMREQELEERLNRGIWEQSQEEVEEAGQEG